MKHTRHHIKSFALWTSLSFALFTATACSSLLDVADLSGPDYTNEQAVSSMENMVKSHAAQQNAAPGPLQTICNFEGSLDGDEVYHCTTLVKDSMVVLYADCRVDGCVATGYDRVEKSDE